MDEEQQPRLAVLLFDVSSFGAPDGDVGVGRLS
jgi:hypothetical protein